MYYPTDRSRPHILYRWLHFLFPLCLALLAALLAGCGQTAGGGLTLTGSTSVTPFAEHLAELYMHAHPGTIINVQGLGSSAGIQAAESGTAEIGMSSRALEEEEAAVLDQAVIAYDALAVIVHPANPVLSLNRSEIQRLFMGSVDVWSEVGGPAEQVTLISREAGSGTYSAFEELLMEQQLISSTALRQGSNGAIRQIVADDPNAIGYISLGIVDSSVRALAIDGVVPSAEHVLDRSYTLVRPFLFVWRKDQPLSALAQQFRDYVLSPEAQQELVLRGLVAANDE
jgi:phosphate transport system substrate-binding protein